MVAKHYLSDIFRHMNSADALVWRSILSLPNPWDDDKLMRLLYHMHATQHAFLAIWEDKPIEIPEPTSFTDIISIAKWGHGFHKEAARFISETDESELTRSLNIPWTDVVEEKLGRKAGEVTLEGAMLQVALHSSHHRGQLNARIRELGGEPPMIDYIAWLWIEKQEADWDFVDSLQHKEA